MNVNNLESLYQVKAFLQKEQFETKRELTGITHYIRNHDGKKMNSTRFHLDDLVKRTNLLSEAAFKNNDSKELSYIFQIMEGIRSLENKGVVKSKSNSFLTHSLFNRLGRFLTRISEELRKYINKREKLLDRIGSRAPALSRKIYKADAATVQTRTTMAELPSSVQPATGPAPKGLFRTGATSAQATPIGQVPASKAPEPTLEQILEDISDHGEKMRAIAKGMRSIIEDTSVETAGLVSSSDIDTTIIVEKSSWEVKDRVDEASYDTKKTVEDTSYATTKEVEDASEKEAEDIHKISEAVTDDVSTLAGAVADKNFSTGGAIADAVISTANTTSSKAATSAEAIADKVSEDKTHEGVVSIAAVTVTAVNNDRTAEQVNAAAKAVLDTVTSDQTAQLVKGTAVDTDLSSLLKEMNDASAGIAQMVKDQKLASDEDARAKKQADDELSNFLKTLHQTSADVTKAINTITSQEPAQVVEKKPVKEKRVEADETVQASIDRALASVDASLSQLPSVEQRLGQYATPDIAGDASKRVQEAADAVLASTERVKPSSQPTYTIPQLPQNPIAFESDEDRWARMEREDIERKAKLEAAYSQNPMIRNPNAFESVEDLWVRMDRENTERSKRLEAEVSASLERAEATASASAQRSGSSDESQGKALAQAGSLPPSFERKLSDFTRKHRFQITLGNGIVVTNDNLRIVIEQGEDVDVILEKLGRQYARELHPDMGQRKGKTEEQIAKDAEKLKDIKQEIADLRDSLVTSTEVKAIGNGVYEQAIENESRSRRRREQELLQLAD